MRRSRRRARAKPVAALPWSPPRSRRSNQTAKATEEIGAQVTAVQGETSGAVEGIQSICATIQQVDEISAAIAAAVGQQGTATQEIAQNVQQAAARTGEVSQNSAGVTDGIAATGTAAEEVLVLGDRAVETVAAAARRSGSLPRADSRGVGRRRLRLRPHHHVDRALHDRLQLLPRHARAGTDGDGVDGGGGELRQRRRIGAFWQFALFLGTAETSSRTPCRAR